ncbi:uncharacterized protein [Phaseolus vulgaris]|uniref:uncharacterized protein n=1 Tax=Phaseolus vulgaris TaxID=3885 RepID=UPI0035CB9AF9
MAKLPQQLYVVHSSQSQSQSIMCDFCGGDHPNGHCSYLNNSSEIEDSSMLERMSKVEEALTKLVIMEENSMTTIRNIEIQMGKVAKQFEEIQSGQFLVDNQTNPKEHCNKVIAEKEDETEELEREMKRSGEEKIKNKERSVLEKDLSYPHPPSKTEKDKKFFDKLLPRNYFAGNLKQDSTFERFLKNRSYIEERNRELEARCSIMTQRDLLQNSKNLGGFNLPVSIGVLSVCKAALYLGDLEVQPTKMQLAKRSIKDPYRVVEDVLVTRKNAYNMMQQRELSILK